MVYKGAIDRVLRIACGGGAATAFTVEKSGVQYLITAKHLFKAENYPQKTGIQLLLDKGYKTFNAEIKYHSIDSVDIAVLKIDPYEQITPITGILYTSNGLTLGQDIWFLGYPFHFDSLLGPKPNTCVPMPFVKKACMSGIHEKEKVSWLILDGHNNPGFSGGPVYAYIKDKLQFVGVVCNYFNEPKTVFTKQGAETPFLVNENSGIVFACDIKHALTILNSF